SALPRQIPGGGRVSGPEASAPDAGARCGRSAGSHTFASDAPKPSWTARGDPAKTLAGMLDNLGCNDPDSPARWNFRTLNLGTLKSTRRRDGSGKWVHELWQVCKTADLSNLSRPELQSALANALANAGRIVIVEQGSHQRRSREAAHSSGNRAIARRVNPTHYQITISLAPFDPAKPGQVREFCEQHRLAHAAVIAAVKGNNRGLHIQVDSPFRTEFRRLLDVVAERAEARHEKLQARFQEIELRLGENKNTAARAAPIEGRKAAIETMNLQDCEATIVVSIDSDSRVPGVDMPPSEWPMTTIAMLFDLVDDAACHSAVLSDATIEG
ncbi:MAG: hypothetical protein ACREDT_00240, partial [Methylocella sp.]